MSASLVGSEMCIRDSWGAPANRPASHPEMEAAQAVDTGHLGDERRHQMAPNPGSKDAGRPAERGKLRPRAERS
eukprot:2806813-Alexandrium_andersonii.AAC.2